MRVSLRWLADYVDIDLPPKELVFTTPQPEGWGMSKGMDKETP
jgi:hypothetical protein